MQAEEGDKRKCDKCSLLIYLVVMVILNDVFTHCRLSSYSAGLIYHVWLFNINIGGVITYIVLVINQ